MHVSCSGMVQTIQYCHSQSTAPFFQGKTTIKVSKKHRATQVMIWWMRADPVGELWVRAGTLGSEAFGEGRTMNEGHLETEGVQRNGHAWLDLMLSAGVLRVVKVKRNAIDSISFANARDSTRGQGMPSDSPAVENGTTASNRVN